MAEGDDAVTKRLFCVQNFVIWRTDEKDRRREVEERNKLTRKAGQKLGKK